MYSVPAPPWGMVGGVAEGEDRAAVTETLAGGHRLPWEFWQNLAALACAKPQG